MTPSAVEIALNQESPEPTTWANLGLWQPGDIYAQAAARLACTVADAAQLAAGQTLLDLGSGLGQQCSLWRERYGVARIIAVNPDPSQTPLLQQHLQPADTLVDQPAPQSLQSLPARSIDVALSVDAAYFIPNRSALLQQLRRLLRPGGYYAWTDIALIPGAGWTAPLAQRSLALAGIPGRERQTPSQLEQQLHSLGWTLRSQQDLTAPVFTGFSQWWQRYAQRTDIPRRLRQRCAFTAAAFRANQRFGWWTYQLYVAQTPPAANIAGGV